MHVTFEDEEFFKRKFETKQFSIKVDKMSEKDIEECKKKYKSSPRRNISNGISRSPTPNAKETDTKLSRRKVKLKYCNSNCEQNENFYKEKFHIQECQISLPRMNESSTNKKRKLAFIFDYLTFFFLLKVCFSVVVVIPLVLYFL